MAFCYSAAVAVGRRLCATCRASWIGFSSCPPPAPALYSTDGFDQMFDSGRRSAAGCSSAAATAVAGVFAVDIAAAAVVVVVEDSDGGTGRLFVCYHDENGAAVVAVVGR